MEVHDHGSQPFSAGLHAALVVATILSGWPLTSAAGADEAGSRSWPERRPIVVEASGSFSRGRTAQPPKAAPTRVPLQPPGQSNFKPRFKSPAVKQAQHVEAESAAAPQASEKPAEATLQPTPMPAEALHSAGRGSVDEALAKSKVAKTESDYHRSDRSVPPRPHGRSEEGLMTTTPKS